MNHANTLPTPNRAAYELGHLLMQMPANFDGVNPLSAEDRKIVEAIREEAIANHETLMHGSEAMGKISFWAGINNKHNEISAISITSISSLATHLAVEMQFFTELENSIRRKLEMLDKAALAACVKPNDLLG